MRKLSKALKEGKIEITYAHCCVCQETFIDDVTEHVICPNGCPVLLSKGYIPPHIPEEQPCLWDAMPETYPGSGIKVGQLACPCSKCRTTC